MDWLNYHHLLYFWIVAREGTVAAACERLGLAQPTVSTQIRSLERRLGRELFTRRGRRLELTDFGRLVYRYADEIFPLGQELLEVASGRNVARPSKLHVGVADALPKLIVHRLVEPALRADAELRVRCIEGKPRELLAALATHELDVILTDTPSGPESHVRVYDHLLGECDIGVFAIEKWARRARRSFPESLADVPLLLPTENTMLRRSLNRWFEAAGIRPKIVGEFEDSALLKTFAQAGVGAFFAPQVVAVEVQDQYRVRSVGRVSSIRDRYFATSIERRVKHPAVQNITRVARNTIFAKS